MARKPDSTYADNPQDDTATCLFERRSTRRSVPPGDAQKGILKMQISEYAAARTYQKT
jgi:hypothetical protein